MSVVLIITFFTNITGNIPVQCISEAYNVQLCQTRNLTDLKRPLIDTCSNNSQICIKITHTVKPVLRGQHWDNEKVAL